MQFADDQFDYIICNHVMEHIENEKRAFFEIRRCLRAQGILVFTVPICWEEKTYEDSNVRTDDERRTYYGQADHVRLYGNDLVERIEKFGFEVSLYRASDILEKRDIDRLGFIEKDVVLLCKKAKIENC